MKATVFNRRQLKIEQLLVFGILLLAILYKPWNDSWQRIISGDGLGYYSYLPHMFVYRGEGAFSWFNDVYPHYYSQEMFQHPRDHFMVQTQEGGFNKYAPGLALLWLPFFLIAHGIALALHLPADGFSQCYQIAVGCASIIFMVLCVCFSLKLFSAFKLHNVWIRLFALLLLVFGTGLFEQSLWYSGLSHVYSAALLTGMLLFLENYKSSLNIKHVGWAFFCFILLVSIRPLLLLTLVLWLPYRTLKPLHGITFKQLVLPCSLIILIISWTLGWNVYQYGQIWKYTYVNESFAWFEPHLFHLFWNYSLGLVWQRPWIIVAILALLLFFKTYRFWALGYILLTYVYACWWYWPILDRALIDLSIIPALAITQIAHKVSANAWRTLMFTCSVMAVCTGWHVLKSYQRHIGIIDSYASDADDFFSNAFRIRPASIFSVPKNSIIKQQLLPFSYGNSAGIVLKPKNGFYESDKIAVPDFFKSTDIKKIKIQFTASSAVPPKNLHLWIRLYAKGNQLLKEFPFYLNSTQLQSSPEKYAFGCSEINSQGLFYTAEKISCAFWLPEDKGWVEIQDLKGEAFTTNTVYETIR